MLSVNAPIDRPLFFTNGVVHVVGTGNAATQNKLAGVVTLGTAGTFLLEANTVGTVTGEITGPGDLIKTGAGYLALLGANTYTGNTVVSNGVLELFEHTTGSPVGSIANSARIHLESPGALDVYWASPWTLGANQILTGRGGINGSVSASGTVAPGTSGSLGWLNVSYDLALAGTNIMKITRSGGLANDTLTVAGYLAYGGVLKVVLTDATPLTVNDTFTLFYFPNAAPSGSFTDIQMPSGYDWDTSQLAVSGTVRVTAVWAPPTLGMTQIGDDLQFSWTGSYKLQAQTNSVSVGLSTNWFDYPDGTNGVTVPIDNTQGSVFFRLSTP
jgi:autotransporter-associated beta strand protein